MSLKTENSGETAKAGEDATPLSFLTPGATRRLDPEKAERQAKRVGKLRIVLPLIALFFMGALILWPMIAPEKIVKMAVANIPDLVIQNLHFNGLDSKNEPYSLNAAKATRPSGLANIYDLDKPQGEITLDTGTWLSGKALYGRFDQATRRLWLGGDVQLFHDKGYQFTTDEAQVNITDSYAWGEKPVLIQGDFGTIRGQGFRLLENGSVMVVKGPAHATLNLHGADASDKPTTAPQKGN